MVHKEALKRRLTNLETAAAPADEPFMFLGITGQLEPLGFDGGGVFVERRPGETPEALRQRCRDVRPPIVGWMARYAPRSA